MSISRRNKGLVGALMMATGIGGAVAYNAATMPEIHFVAGDDPHKIQLRASGRMDQATVQECAQYLEYYLELGRSDDVDVIVLKDTDSGSSLTLKAEGATPDDVFYDLPNGLQGSFVAVSATQFADYCIDNDLMGVLSVAEDAQAPAASESAEVSNLDI